MVGYFISGKLMHSVPEGFLNILKKNICIDREMTDRQAHGQCLFQHLLNGHHLEMLHRKKYFPFLISFNILICRNFIIL